MYGVHNEYLILPIYTNSIDVQTLLEKCPYSELFWSAFSRIGTECGEIPRISQYSVQMRENADQNNYEYGHFFCAVQYSSHIQHWWEFCSYWNANPFNASFNDNAEFRTQYFLRLECEYSVINLLSANPTRWSNTLKQFVGNFPTNCLIVFDHFVRLALRVNTAKSALSSIFPFDNVLTFGK